MKLELTKNNLWLGLRFAVLPALLIPPFWLTKYTTETCSKAWVSTGSKLHPGEKTLATVSQATPNPHLYGFLLVALLLSFLIVSCMQVGPKKYRLRYARAKQQLAVAAASAVITIPVYAYMHHWSQYRFPPNWSCESDGIMHGGLNAQAHFGLGLAPIVALVITAIYILAPLGALLATRPKSHKLWTS